MSYIITENIYTSWICSILRIVFKEMEKMGLFILASNDISIASEEVLKYYEGQDNLERGFRFLKSDAFSVSKVYQKNKARMK